MKDRFYYGFMAGLIASLAQAVLTHTLYFLDLTDLRFNDFAGTFIYGHKPLNLYEGIWAELIMWMFGGFLGILFAYLIPVVTSSHYIFKGWLYSTGLWFFIYALMVLFNVQGLEFVDLKSAISNFAAATVYGIVLAIASKKIVSTN